MLKRKFITVAAAISLLMPPSAKADMFGGDVAVLMQILTQNIKQLIELQSIL